MFGDTPLYLVNDAQKAEIEANMRPRRPALVAAMLIAGMAVWVLTVANLVGDFGSGRVDPTGGDLLAMIVLMAVPMLVGAPVVVWIQRRRLTRVLAGLA